MTHVVELLRRLDLRATATVLTGSIVVVALVGVVTLWLDPENPWLDLDSEVGMGWPPTEITLALPAIWSALLFTFAGLGWLAVGWSGSSMRVRPVALGLGAALVFFALDEVLIVHERLEARSGLDWQLIYMPVALVTATLLGVLAWLFRRREPRASWLLAGGGGCYALASVLELTQWRGDEQIASYGYLMIPEELLELAGSSLLALAALLALHSLPAVPEATPPASAHE